MAAPHVRAGTQHSLAAGVQQIEGVCQASRAVRTAGAQARMQGFRASRRLLAAAAAHPHDALGRVLVEWIHVQAVLGCDVCCHRAVAHRSASGERELGAAHLQVEVGAAGVGTVRILAAHQAPDGGNVRVDGVHHQIQHFLVCLACQVAVWVTCGRPTLKANYQLLHARQPSRAGAQRLRLTRLTAACIPVIARTISSDPASIALAASLMSIAPSFKWYPMSALSIPLVRLVPSMSNAHSAV